jgi:hypothetical protein
MAGRNAPMKSSLHGITIALVLLVLGFSSFAAAQEKDGRLSKFLKETEHLDFTHPVFSRIMAKILTDRMLLKQKLERLYYFTRDPIPFANDASLKASEALAKLKALCYTKAMIYVSFCRKLGVPARCGRADFVIKADPRARVRGHAIAQVYFNRKWIFVDAVSNRDAWTWWDKKNAATFHAPAFALEKNVLIDKKYVSIKALKGFETNDVPQEWLDQMRKFLATGKW